MPNSPLHTDVSIDKKKKEKFPKLMQEMPLASTEFNNKPKSQAQSQMTDYKYGFNESVNMGPSNLLKASGTQHKVPRIGDYHINLTKNFGYNPTGPGDYTLPALFDNLKKPNIGCSAAVKRNPHMDIQHNYNKKLFLSKEHLREQLMTESPIVDNNYPVKDKTFEFIRFKSIHMP